MQTLQLFFATNRRKYNYIFITLIISLLVLINLQFLLALKGGRWGIQFALPRIRISKNAQAKLGLHNSFLKLHSSK